MKYKIVLLTLLIVSCSLYVLTLKGVSGNPDASMVKGNLDQSTKPLELSPERGRYLLTMSLAKNGSFSLPQSYADAAYPDVGYYNGRFYVFFAPGISLLALPFYVVGSYFGYAQVGTFSLSTVFALLNLLILYRIGRDVFKFSIPYALMPPVIFGFASSSWAYAVTLYQHHVTTFYMLSGFYAVWRYAQKRKMAWMWALYVWFVYGCALLIDYPNALLLMPVMVYFFSQSVTIEFARNAIRVLPRFTFITTSALFIVIMILHGYYNLVNYGGWTHLSGGLIGYKTIVEKQLLSNPDKFAELKRIEQQKDPVAFFTEYNFPFGLYTLLISPDRGLFVYYPVYVLALLGVLYAVKHRNTIHVVLLSLVIVDVFLYSSFGDPWGGWAFGSRYLIPSMAILALYIPLWLRSSAYPLTARVLMFTCFLYSTAVSLAGVLTTLAVPPKVEADFLKTKYNFLLNFDYILTNRSSSIAYNEIFSSIVTLQNYYFIILGIVLSIFVALLVWSRRYRYEI